MKYIPVSYQQWLLQHDIDESHITMDCPKCPSVGILSCEICHGNGIVSVTYAEYEAQVVADRKQFDEYQHSVGMRRCVCGSWEKQLFKTRWSTHDLCRKCFEAMASEIREEAKEHDYDRHHKWGQGL